MIDGHGSRGVLDLLLGEAARHPLLDPVEETELARRAEAGDGEALRRLVGSHLRYVVKIARRYRGWGLPMNDLVQQGTLGLIQAVRRFDPDRGVRLSTYAMWWIRSAIQEHVLESWSMVRLGTSNAQKALALTFRRFAADWAGHAGRDGESVDEAIARLAKQFNATAADVARLARRMAGRDASLDTTRSHERSEESAATVCDRPTPEEAVEQANHRRMVLNKLRDALAQLSPREQIVIRKRYFEEAKHTFAAIGAELGVSKDRARQLEAKALAKLDGLLRPARSSLLP